MPQRLTYKWDVIPLGLTAHPTSCLPALSLLSCLTIPPAIPNTNPPPAPQSRSHIPLPCSNGITFKLGICRARIPREVAAHIEFAVDATHGTKPITTSCFKYKQGIRCRIISWLSSRKILLDYLEPGKNGDKYSTQISMKWTSTDSFWTACTKTNTSYTYAWRGNWPWRNIQNPITGVINMDCDGRYVTGNSEVKKS